MLKKLLASLLLACCTQAAHAVPVALTFEGNLSSLQMPAPAGERFTLTVTVDNGGTTTAAQTWTAADFLSFRLQGASGWWIEALSIRTANSTGSFATDARGAVTSTGAWTNVAARQPLLPASGSYNWLETGGWRVNATSAIMFSSPQGNGEVASLWYVDDASKLGLASNWKASVVPVPASLPLLAAGIGALSLARRKSRKA